VCVCVCVCVCLCVFTTYRASLKLACEVLLEEVPVVSRGEIVELKDPRVIRDLLDAIPAMQCVGGRVGWVGVSEQVSGVERVWSVGRTVTGKTWKKGVCGQWEAGGCGCVGVWVG
jgi:hypothetical protein